MHMLYIIVTMNIHYHGYSINKNTGREICKKKSKSRHIVPFKNFGARNYIGPSWWLPDHVSHNVCAKYAKDKEKLISVYTFTPPSFIR